jgi:hypothetical protein
LEDDDAEQFKLQFKTVNLNSNPDCNLAIIYNEIIPIKIFYCDTWTYNRPDTSVKNGSIICISRTQTSKNCSQFYITPDMVNSLDYGIYIRSRYSNGEFSIWKKLI